MRVNRTTDDASIGDKEGRIFKDFVHRGSAGLPQQYSQYHFYHHGDSAYDTTSNNDCEKYEYVANPWLVEESPVTSQHSRILAHAHLADYEGMSMPVNLLQLVV